MGKKKKSLLEIWDKAAIHEMCVCIHIYTHTHFEYVLVKLEAVIRVL